MEIRCRSISLADARELAPIPSEFETDRVYRLRGGRDGRDYVWLLREEQLGRLHRKIYDNGKLDSWIESYTETIPIEEMNFVLAEKNGSILGLMTWHYSRWNNCVWLADIRTRRAERRQGVGSALIATLKEVARRLEARGILLETQTDNYPAITFYKRHGFALAGFNDHLYSNTDPEDDNVALFLFWPRT